MIWRTHLAGEEKQTVFEAMKSAAEWEKEQNKLRPVLPALSEMISLTGCKIMPGSFGYGVIKEPGE